ncbi:Hypothetical predicted protein [Olea europaea subsp. europaea]|uniref:VPS37 C-terminal domain-containing protein n=1 Tax=Olea europaea subsp. europaea TaxID=158383 RepID=A0A8S0R3B7_OLEEU|nr:Hypothetical predicted protein [Olea europaea subsp. europaea]
MFKSFWGSQEQQAQPHPQEISTDSWYPPSVVSSTSSSRPPTSSVTSSSNFSVSRPPDRSNSFSNVSPAEAAGIIAQLKDKSLDELRKLLSDKDAYQNLFHLLEPVKTQNRVRDELRNETLKLTRANLEKEPRIMELRNQVTVFISIQFSLIPELLSKFLKPSTLLLRGCSAKSSAQLSWLLSKKSCTT